MRDVGALKRLPLFFCEAQVVPAILASSSRCWTGQDLRGTAWWSSTHKHNPGPRTWTAPLDAPLSVHLDQLVMSSWQARVGTAMGRQL